MNWEKRTEEKFKQLITKVPVFMRGIAQDKVSKRAHEIVPADNRIEITEKDIVAAFVDATPFGFHGPMKTDMEEAGIDYTQYGHKKS